MSVPFANSALSANGTEGDVRISLGEPLRVLHVSAGNMYGGVETLLTTLARFRNLCPEMESHFALCYEGRLRDELVAAGASVYLLGEVRISRPWTAWKARRRLRALLQERRFEVICHMVWPLAIFGETVRAAETSLAFWAHSGHTGKPWLERLARRTVPDLAISTSRFVASSLSSIFPDAPMRVVYAPVPYANSTEASQSRAAARFEQGVAENTAVIIQVSRFEDWKGHLLHLQALSLIKDVPGWVCWMVGGPHNSLENRYFQEVQQACSALGLSDRVRFLGPRSDVERLLAGADIFCQPNQGPEPFGIVFIEALRAGRPVVTTSMGGALEIVDESCGLLVEPNNSQRLADALRRLISSSDLRSTLGQNGPARARQLCDPRTQMNLLAHLLRDVAGNRK